MTEQEFISSKIANLQKEGYSKAQAYMIAKSAYQKRMSQQGEEYYQQAGMWSLPDFNLQAQAMSPQQDFSRPQPPLTQNLSVPPSYYESNPPMFSLDNQNAPTNKYDYTVSGVDNAKRMEDTSKQSSNENTQYNTRYNLINNYGGLDLEGSLSYTGQQFGKGNTVGGIAGAGLSLLKGARNLMSGFASGKESERVKNEYLDNTFNYDPNYEMLQQGGKINNSEFLTGQYIADEGQGNITMENQEFVKRADSGQVQQVVGEPHIKNGKIAEGVKATLNDGDKVLSTYTEIPAKDVKELKKRYEISLKKGATFADAQKAFDKKIGIKKTTDELAGYIEKLGKNESVDDVTTKRLNELVLTKEIKEYKNKLDVLKEPQSMIFEDLFQRQELIPKKGNGTQIFDKDGKEVTETEDVAQEGMQMNLENKEINDSYRRTLSTYKVPTYKIGETEYEVSRLGALHPKGTLKPSIFGAVSKNAPFMKEKQDKDNLSSLAVTEVGQNRLDEERTAKSLYELNRGWILDEKGNRVKKVEIPDFEEIYGASLQEGGIIDLAKKHGITEQRAMELIQMQEGGEVSQEEQIQQLFQEVSKMLQQGVSPEEVAQQLVQMGVPQQEVANIIQQVAQQLQGQSAQEEGQQMAQEGVYTFSTKYTPNLAGYDVEGNSVVNSDRLTGVENIQPYTGQGYGVQMASVDDTIKTHGWYFDTEDKKQAFKEASIKEGEQPEIQKFQKAYNEEIRRRAKEAGLPESEISKVINEVGFTGGGVQQFDGKYGAFTSTRPLFNFSKKDGQVKVEVIDSPVIEANKTQNVQDRTENVLPWLPQDLRLPPSSLDPIAKEQIYLPRMEAIKATTEPMLAEQERLRQTDIERIRNSGLTIQQQEALLASGLTSSQMASNDAISKVEQYNAQNQYAVDNFNIGQVAKENISNAQFRQDYQNKAMQSLANQERDWRNFYTEGNLQNRQNFKDIENINMLNSQNENYQYIPGQGVQYLPTTKTDLSLPSLTQEQADKMTPKERINYMKMVAAKNKYRNSNNQSN